jgi:transposase
MRGEDRTSGALFCYIDVEARIPAKHPLRAMREVTNAALAELDGAFSTLYEGCGRPSIPPERLLRATLLQLLYSIRSERQLVERLEFDLLFRWFVGLSLDEAVFDPSTFSKNRDRLLTHEIAHGFLSSLLGLPEVKGLLSAEHFSVDGTLLKAWASMKSFRPKACPRAKTRGMARASRRRRGAMARRTFARPSGRTKRTPRRRTRTRGCSARATGRRAVLPISATR